MASNIRLRDYQRDCIRIIDNLEGGSHLVQMATGLGKTVTFSQIERKGRVLLLSHRDELVRQPVRYYDCPVGIEKADERSDGEPVVSASVQTLSSDRRLSRFEPGEFDMIVTDEAHHALAASYRKIYDYLRPRLHVGFTATPNRGDGRGLEDVFDDIIFVRDLKWGIAKGYLCDLDCMQVTVSWRTDRLKKIRGDFSAHDLAEAVNIPSANEQVAAAYQQFRKGPTLIFASSVSHARALGRLIPRSRVISGDMPQSERDAAVAAFREGRLDCLINCMVFTEGTDMPWVQTILLARPTQSSGLYTQMVGRGLRQSPETGKTDCLLIDCVGASRDRRLATPASLVGINADDLVNPGVIDGRLSELQDRIDADDDIPSGWVLRARRVDVLSQSKIAWRQLGNGGRVVRGRTFSVTMSAPDLLGQVTVTYQGRARTVRTYDTVGQAEDAVYSWLASNPASKNDRHLWDSERAGAWELEPSTEKQRSLIRNKMSEADMREACERLGADWLTTLSKAEAGVVINNLLDKEESRLAREYGRCPLCGRALRPNRKGTRIGCSSNHWEKQGDFFTLADGCGFGLPVYSDNRHPHIDEIKRALESEPLREEFVIVSEPNVQGPGKYRAVRSAEFLARYGAPSDLPFMPTILQSGTVDGAGRKERS